jgi:hypothetical protein
MSRSLTAWVALLGLVIVLVAVFAWRGCPAPPPAPAPEAQPEPALGSGARAGPSPGGVAAAEPPPRIAPADPPSGPSDDTGGPSVLPELRIGLGSEAFMAKDFETARRHFRSVVDESPDHPMAPYAAYKLGWCEANLGDHRAAVVELQRVITWLRDEGRPEEAVTLREALMDLEHFQGQLDTGG